MSTYPTIELTLYVPGFAGSLEEPPDFNEVERSFTGPTGLVDACSELNEHWMEYGEANFVYVQFADGDFEWEDIDPHTLYNELVDRYGKA